MKITGAYLRKQTGELQILKAGESLELELADRGQFRLYVIVPIRR